MNNARHLKQVNDNDFLSTEEAAEALGIKESAIRNYLHAGKLTTYKFKSLTLVKSDEVERWKTRQRNR